MALAVNAPVTSKAGTEACMAVKVDVPPVVEIVTTPLLAFATKAVVAAFVPISPRAGVVAVSVVNAPVLGVVAPTLVS